MKVSNSNRILIMFFLQLLLIMSTFLFLYSSIGISISRNLIISDASMVFIILLFTTGILGYRNINLNLSILTVILISFVFADIEYFKFFSTLTNLSEFKMIKDVFKPGAGYDFDYSNILKMVFLMLLVCLVPYFYTKKCYDVKPKLKTSLITRTLMIFVAAFSVLQIESIKVNNLKEHATLDGSTEYYKSDLFLYDSLYSSVNYAEKFGYINYKIRSTEVVKIKNIENVDEIDVDEFFYNRTDKHVENEFTNKYNDYNVINLTLETFDSRLIHPLITPNLYELWNTSMRFENHFTPAFMIAPTCNSEFMLLSSIYPNVSDKWASNICLNLGDINLGNTLPNQMTDLGYDTYYIHNGVGSFYNRAENMTNIYGFEETHFTESNDSDMDLLPVLDNIDFDEKFYSYMLTYSMHFGNDEFYDYNEEFVREVLGEDYDSEFVTLYTKAIETDNFVGELIDKLKSENVYDETIIVVTADHWPYGFKTAEEYMDTLGIEYMDDLEIHRLGMFIHDGGKTSGDYDVNSSTINLAPTILNMVSDDFENRYFFGDDIFSEDVVPYFQEIAIYDGNEFIRLEDELDNEKILNNILINDLSSSVISNDLLKKYLRY